MGTDYTFACARVRGNERSLINKDKMLVMIDAKTMEDACKVLQEAGYGEGEVILPSAYEKALEAEVIFACGPTPMLRALKEYAAEKNITCWISMEERMACGVGACLACVCRSKEIDAHSQVHNKRVCKDGPVFLSTEVEL